MACNQTRKQNTLRSNRSRQHRAGSSAAAFQNAQFGARRVRYDFADCLLMFALLAVALSFASFVGALATKRLGARLKMLE